VIADRDFMMLDPRKIPMERRSKLAVSRPVRDLSDLRIGRPKDNEGSTRFFD